MALRTPRGQKIVSRGEAFFNGTLFSLKIMFTPLRVPFSDSQIEPGILFFFSVQFISFQTHLRLLL